MAIMWIMGIFLAICLICRQIDNYNDDLFDNDDLFNIV